MPDKIKRQSEKKSKRKNKRCYSKCYSKYYCYDSLINVFPGVVETGATQFLCFSIPISGFQASRPNDIGCVQKEKKKQTYVYCHCCGKTFKVIKVDNTNKLGCFANIDFEHDRVYNLFSESNVQTDRRIRRLDPNLKYRTRPIKLRKNSKDLCPGICKRCLDKRC